MNLIYISNTQEEREFRNNQAKAMEKADEASLLRKRKEVDEKEMLLAHRTTLLEQLTKTNHQLLKDVEDITQNIERVQKEHQLSISQAKTEDKAQLQKALTDVLHDLEVTRGAKETSLSTNRKEIEFAEKDIEAVRPHN
jgi:molecular chaperone GrpE (heat shock protein)